jgi:hypothetical protein
MPSSSTTDDRHYNVVVLELEDVVPRRDPKRPNLLVARTLKSAEDFATDLRNSRSKRHKWAHGRVLRIRHDLSSQEPLLQDDAETQQTAISAELKRKGYTVNRDGRVWRTYVVNLNDPKQTEIGAGHVYVGETSLPVEERLQQHLTGARNNKGPLFSRVVRNHGTTLNRQLMAGKAYMTQKQAKKAERRLAERLRNAGFLVEGGH